MNPTITKCVFRAGGILQKRSISLCAAPRSTVPARIFNPRLPRPRICFALRTQIFSPSRLLSTTDELFKKAEDTTTDWDDGPIPDAAKQNERMDDLKTGIEIADDVKNQASLQEEGIATDLPNIEETKIRDRENSLGIGQPVDDLMQGWLDDGDYEEDQEYDGDEEYDTEYDILEEYTDEEIDELIEQAGEEQGGWNTSDFEEEGSEYKYEEFDGVDEEGLDEGDVLEEKEDKDWA